MLSSMSTGCIMSVSIHLNNRSFHIEKSQTTINKKYILKNIIISLIDIGIKEVPIVLLEIFPPVYFKLYFHLLKNQRYTHV